LQTSDVDAPGQEAVNPVAAVPGWSLERRPPIPPPLPT